LRWTSYTIRAEAGDHRCAGKIHRCQLNDDEPLSKFGFWADWQVAPKWNLCNAPGDNGGKVKSRLGVFLGSADKVLVCTHATFRFAVDQFGVEAFDDRLIAVDEFHHVSANPDNKLGSIWGSSSPATRCTSSP
jgi:hypothetical protein